MTRKQIQAQIAAFTGDWKTAARKAKVFDENCCVPLSQVKSIELAFGKYGDSHGNYAPLSLYHMGRRKIPVLHPELNVNGNLPNSK